MQLRDKTITIFGLGTSGLGLALLLESHGARVKVTDSGDNAALRKNATLLGPQAAVQLGKHTDQFIEGSDVIVISPGVSANLPVLQMAQNANIPIIG